MAENIEQVPGQENVVDGNASPLAADPVLGENARNPVADHQSVASAEDHSWNADVPAAANVEIDNYLTQQRDLNQRLQNLATAKRELTRRTNQFLQLLEGDAADDRQALVASRNNMVIAAETLRAQLDDFAAQLPAELGHHGYLNGRERYAQAMDYYGQIYEDRLATFVHDDSLPSYRTLPHDAASVAASHLTAAEVERLSTELEDQAEEENRHLELQTRREARQLEHRQNQLRNTAHAERDERAARRRLRQEQEELEREERFARERAERERRYEEEREEREAVLAQQRAEEALRLEEQELADRASVAREQLAATHRRQQDQLAAALSGSRAGSRRGPGSRVGSHISVRSGRTHVTLASVLSRGARRQDARRVLPATVGVEAYLPTANTNHSSGSNRPQIIPPVQRPVQGSPGRTASVAQGRPPSSPPAHQRNLVTQPPVTPDPCPAATHSPPMSRTAHQTRSSTPSVALPSMTRESHPPVTQPPLEDPVLVTIQPDASPYKRSAQARREDDDHEYLRAQRLVAMDKEALEMRRENLKLAQEELAFAQERAKIHREMETTSHRPTREMTQLPADATQYRELPTAVGANIKSPDSQDGNSLGSSTTSTTDLLAVYLQHNLQGSDRKKFNGNAMDYPDFLADYQQSTQRLQDKPGMCLQILRTMLGDTVKGNIKHYLAPTKDEARSLARALETLEMAYGSEIKQSRAQMTALKNRPKVPPTEKGLLEFYSDLDRCRQIMENCNRQADLNAESFLEQLWLKLPDYLQHKFEKKVARNGSMATFDALLDIVKTEHKTKSGQVNQWRETHRKSDKAVKQKADKPGSKEERRTKINQVRFENPSESRPLQNNGHQTHPVMNTFTCLCGPGGTHQYLEQCPSYKATQGKHGKLQLLKSQRACFRCTGVGMGHVAPECPHGPCNINGCRRFHHHTIHNSPSERDFPAFPASGSNQRPHQRSGKPWDAPSYPSGPSQPLNPLAPPRVPGPPSR